MRQMYQFSWDSKKLSMIIAHTMKNPFHTKVIDYDADLNPITKDVKEPELFIVKDRGTYIMSASKKPLFINGTGSPTGEHVVVYAKGHNPNVDEDYYVGGDDYGVRMPIQWAIQAVARKKDLIITVSEDSVSFQLAGEKNK